LILKINENLTTVNFNKGDISRIKYIVVHFTANNGDTAKNNTIYFKSVNRGASAHYFVDENEIWQSVQDKDVAWHCGAKTYRHSTCRNANSIGVEMCSRKNDKGQFFIKDEVISNTAELVKYLMEKYKVPIENVIRHYDVTGKICPDPFVRDAKQWESFKCLLNTTPEGVTTYRISEENLAYMVAIGVINSPDYWRNQSVQWLDELLSKASKNGVLDSRIDNGIIDIDIAFDVLKDAGIIDSPDYWKGLLKEDRVQYLENLLINIANKCRIVLEKIVHAEARGESEHGQRLVVNVILNRHNSKNFPNGIHNIVFQNGVNSKGDLVYQFSPIADGAYAKAIPSESVKNAVTKVLDGWDESKGSLYFRTVKGLEGSWHQQALTELFRHGCHVFFR